MIGKGLRRDARPFLCSGKTAVYGETQKAAKLLPTEKAVAVNLNGICICRVKDKNK